jgi:hypothetical protein
MFPSVFFLSTRWFSQQTVLYVEVILTRLILLCKIRGDLQLVTTAGYRICHFRNTLLRWIFFWSFPLPF